MVLDSPHDLIADKELPNFWVEGETQFQTIEGKEEQGNAIKLQPDQIQQTVGKGQRGL